MKDRTKIFFSAIQHLSLSLAIGEKFNLADQKPWVIKEIEDMVQAHLKTVDSVGTQLEKRIVKQ